jgi:RHS repeat-associated protein
LGFEYDSALNVTAITDALNPALTQHFIYDELDRLTGESSSFRAGAGLTYTYGDPIRVHAVTHTSDSRAYQYDGNGNLVTDGSRSFAYDFDNRVSCMRASGAQALAYPACATAPDATTTVVGYSADGQRVKKEGPSGSTIYIGRLYERTGPLTTRHVFAGGLRIASVSSDGTVKYYHSDHLGSTRVVTGSASESLAYRPFGAPQSDNAPSVTKFKFTSQELDVESGRYLFPARPYDPTLGRFTSPDTMVSDFEDPQALNRYSYARNNPGRFVDPSGHQTECFLFLCISYPGDDDGGGGGGGGVPQDPGYNPLPPGYPNPPAYGGGTTPVGQQPVPYNPSARPPPAIRGTASTSMAGSRDARVPAFGTPEYYPNRYRSTSRVYRQRALALGKEYLIDYGYRYARMFQELKFRTASRAVAEAVDSITVELQIALEAQIAENPQLLENPFELGQVAFRTHSDAYARGGFGNLTLAEQAEFLDVIDLGSLTDFGVGPAAEVAWRGLGMVNWPLPGLVPYPWQ